MTDTTLQNAVPDVAAAPSPLDVPIAASPPAVPPLPRMVFSDAEGASRWAKTLPLLPVGQAYDALTGQLKACAAAQMPPRERAKIAEILREQVNHLHTELARRYAGRPQPEGEREAEAVDQAIGVWHALWEQYSTCLKPLLEGDPELLGVKSKILQRGLYVAKQLVLVHGLSRRSVPASVWQELHAYYRLAEMLDCAGSAVSDEQLPNGVGTSPYSMYSHALLLGLADPCAMSVRQIELTDRWLGQWSRKLFPYARQRDIDGPIVIIDLEGQGGATLAPLTPQEARASLRFGYPAKLATSVRGRLRRLASGANPAELQLGQDVSVEQCVALLSHLDLHWCQCPRHDDAEAASIELATGGVPAVFYRIGGRTFERKEPGPRTLQHAQHLQSLGALTDYDRGREEAERDWPWERWEGQYGWRDAALDRPADTHFRWLLEQLVAVRDTERMRLAFVARVARDAQGDFALALKLWPGVPRALTLRPDSFAEDAPLPALLLAESPEDRATLITPPRAYTPGRVLRSVDSSGERRFRLTRLIQRGADFERIAFDDE